MLVFIGLLRGSLAQGITVKAYADERWKAPWALEALSTGILNKVEELVGYGANFQFVQVEGGLTLGQRGATMFS